MPKKKKGEKGGKKKGKGGGEAKDKGEEVKKAFEVPGPSEKEILLRTE